MYTYDSTREELDDAIAQVVGSIRMPNINFDEMPLHWLILRGDLADWEQAPYEKVYKELLDPYFMFSNREPIAGCEATFGFNNREINHPILNVMMLDMQRMHYRFMEPIIKKVRKEIEREERSNGEKYDDTTFWWMVRDRAIAIRRGQIGKNTDASISKIDRPVNIDYQRDEYPSEESGGFVDTVQQFSEKHPFLTGLIAGAIYQKTKKFLAR